LYESLEDACKFAVNEYWQSCHLDGHECRDLTCLFHLSVEDQVNLLMHDFDAYQDIVYPFFQKTCDKDYDHEMFRIVKVDVEK
jgi:hypothetical protein